MSLEQQALTAGLNMAAPGLGTLAGSLLGGLGGGDASQGAAGASGGAGTPTAPGGGSGVAGGLPGGLPAYGQSSLDVAFLNALVLGAGPAFATLQGYLGSAHAQNVLFAQQVHSFQQSVMNHQASTVEGVARVLGSSQSVEA